MSKQKTRKIITKRFRITSKGKVLRGQSFRRHLNAKKSSRRKRKLSRVVSTNKIYAKKIKKALGVKKGKKLTK
jgi:large subunit ribosomal protein L35